MKLKKLFFFLALMTFGLILANYYSQVTTLGKDIKGKPSELGEMPLLSPKILENSQKIAVRFQAPKNDGAPARKKHEAAGSRTSCPAYTKDLVVALVPQQNIGWTISHYPTFWFYLPYTSPISFEFTLFDQNQNQVYQKTFQSQGKPGIMSVSLPETAPKLQEEERYKWQLSLICDPRDKSSNITLESYVRKKVLSPDAASQIIKAQSHPQKDLQLLKIYAENGYWHDALTKLIFLRLIYKNDRNLLNEWQELLESVDLGEISNESFSFSPENLLPNPE